MPDQGWKELNANKEKQKAEREVRDRIMYGQKERRDAEGRLVDRYGQVIVDDSEQRRPDMLNLAGGAALGQQGPQQKDPGVPRSHLFIVLVFVALAFIGWIFRAEMRGLVRWGMDAVQGGGKSLSAYAPKLAGVVRGNSPYSAEEFLAVCGGEDFEQAAKILKKQPDLREPDAQGRTLLHRAAPLLAAPAMLKVLFDAGESAHVNARDKAGRTPLHSMAESGTNLSVLLLLRGAGADAAVRDAQGLTPLAVLLQSGGGMPKALTKEESDKFGRFGYRVRDLAAGKSGGTRFVSIASQVDGVEEKRYFTLVAEAINRAKGSGLAVPTLAAGDMIGAPPDPLADVINKSRDPMARAPQSKPLWKSLALKNGTGALMAKVKCLLPEAYPVSINYFSALAVGDAAEPPIAVEWAAWELPPNMRLALMMQVLQQKTRQPSSLQPPMRANDLQQNLEREIRIVGDAPSARNPLLMTWALLENPGGASYQDSNKDLAALVELRRELPDAAWREVGGLLVAASYVAWGAEQKTFVLRLPKKVIDSGGVTTLRLWPSSPGSDAGAPLAAALRVSSQLPENVAEKVVERILRAGPQAMSADKNGLAPLDAARKANAPKVVLELLRAAPPAPDVAEPAPPSFPTRFDPENGLGKKIAL